MTAAEVRAWIAAMLAGGKISRRAPRRDAAALLGIGGDALRTMALHGVDGHTAVRTRLACAALLAGSDDRPLGPL